MDKYLLAITSLIIFTIIVILYIRISGRNNSSNSTDGLDGKPQGSSDDLSDLKTGEDFTILE